MHGFSYEFNEILFVFIGQIAGIPHINVLEKYLFVFSV